MGVEMLLKAVMSILGVTREQLMEEVENAKSEYGNIRDRAIMLDARIARLENNQVSIFEILGRIEKHLGIVVSETAVSLAE